MQRREWLKAIGAIGMGGLAGCSSKSDQNGIGTTSKTTTQTPTTVKHEDEGPPYFEKVDIETPHSSTALENFNFSITVANTGGRSGNFTTTVSVGEDPFNYDIPVEISNVEPGEVRTKEFGPRYISRSGEYQYRITDYGVSDYIKINPYTAERGEAIEIRGLYIKPRSVLFRRNIIYGEEQYSGDIDKSLLASDENEVIAIVQLTIENRGEELKYVGNADFQINDGFDILSEYSGISSIKGAANNPLRSYKFEPGEYASGWVAYEISESALNNGVDLKYPADSPDVIWQFEAESLSAPKYEVINSNVPENVTAYNRATLEYKIKNTGTAAGEFNGQLYVETNDGMRIKEKLEPGDTALINRTFRFPQPDENVKPLNVTFFGHEQVEKDDVVQPVIPQLIVDETANPVEGLEISVNAIISDTSLKTYNGWSDEYEEEQLIDGKKWLFVEIESYSNNSNVPVALKDEFSLESNRADFEVKDTFPGYGESDGESFAGDVVGQFYDPSSSATGPNQSQSGWVVYEVPSDISSNEITVRWTAGTGSYGDQADRGAPYQVTWSE